MCLNKKLIQFPQRCFNGQHATLFHRVPGVGGQIHQHLRDLSVIHIDGQGFLLEFGHEPDVLSDDSSQELSRIRDDPVKVGILRVHDLLAAER